MVAGAFFALLVASGAAVVGGTDSTVIGPRVDALRVGAGIEAPDTVTRVRKKAFQLSEAYGTRLKIHRYASYITLPLFVAEYAAGDQLYKKSNAAPQWAKSSHGALATVVAGLFGVNTLTGGLNWWETRGQPEGRTWRTVHASLELLADAGFVATGILSDKAEGSASNRKLHRSVAVTSMSVATLGYVIMLKPFRRD
jgi:hypothetical protein